MKFYVRFENLKKFFITDRKKFLTVLSSGNFIDKVSNEIYNFGVDIMSDENLKVV